MSDLAGSGEDKHAEVLIAQYLDASDGQAALAALDALGRAQVGLSHIWDATEHRIPRFRSTAFAAMASFRPEEGRGSEPFVLRGLADDNSYVVAAAARAAAALEVVAAAPRLRDLARNENGHVRGAAYLALGQIGDTNDFALLADAVVNDKTERAVERAARGLGQLSGHHTPPPELAQRISTLLDRLDNVRVPVRWTATRGLLLSARHLSFDDEVRQRLLSMLESEAGVRGDVAVALAHQGFQPARPVIETHLLYDPSPRLQVKLLRAIEILGAEPSLPRLLSLAESPLDTATARALIQVLGAIPDERAHHAVLRLARGADVGVRQEAFDRLPAEHPLRLDLALAGLSDPAAPVRSSAALALSDRRDLLEALETALENESVPEVREAIAAAIPSAREALPPKRPRASAGLTPGLLARVPVAHGITGEAIRLVMLDTVGHGGDEEAVVEALERLVEEARRSITAFRR